MANKCSSLSDKPFALIYSKDGIVRYCWRDWKRFSCRVPFKAGDSMPLSSQALTLSQFEEAISDSVNVDPSDWLSTNYKKKTPGTHIEQTYTQLNGYQVTMIRFEA